MDNRDIADALTGYARRLEREGGNLYRVKAYRRAADAVRSFDGRVGEVIRREGAQGLRRLPGVGDHLAFAIERLVTTGEFHTLAPEAVVVPPGEHVRDLPGVGPHLAEQLWEELRVHSVADLDAAVARGDLRRLALGKKRREQLLAALADWRAKRQTVTPVPGEPTVTDLLAVDAEYRRQAKRHRPPIITPRQPNPAGDAWLPIHAERRGDWRLRALFSNTALAHRLGRTHDWVVIYFHGPEGKGQRTVVTEQRGDLRGRRVVRGREDECRQLYNC